MLTTAGWARHHACIAVVVTRQTAALSAATALAANLGLSHAHLGGPHVGYVLPYAARRSANTRVVFFTPASLLSTLHADPLLSSIAVLVLDTGPRRPALIDLLLALLRPVHHVRHNLRLVLITDHVHVAPLITFFSPSCPRVVRVTLPNSPRVTVLYANTAVPDYLDAACNAVKDAVAMWNRTGRPPDADILIFVPTAADVSTLCQTVSDWIVTTAHPAFAAQGDAAFKRRLRRQALLSVSPLQDAPPVKPSASSTLRVLVATDVPERRLMSVSTVVDTGLLRRFVYNARSGGGMFPIVPISRAEARQRARCVWHAMNGTVIRLYTRETYQGLSERSPPEILRSDLMGLMLSARALGVEVLKMRFVAKLSIDAARVAMARLRGLGAMNEDGRLTDIGRRLADAPVPPRIMRAVLAGEELGMMRIVAALAAMLEVRRHVFLRSGRKGDGQRATFAVAEGDCVTLVNVWRRWVAAGRSATWCRTHGVNGAAMKKAAGIFELVVSHVGEDDSREARIVAGRKALGLTEVECLCRCIATGFFENAAMVQPDGTYLVALSGRRVRIDAMSVLCGRMPEWVVFDELVWGEPLWVMREVTVIKPEWLVEVAPDLFQMTVD